MEQLKRQQPILWGNPNVERKPKTFRFNDVQIDEAEARLKRFAPYFMAAFPETVAQRGLIESPITQLKENVFIKRDDILPISGSIKARGGIHEIVAIAEQLALQHNLVTKQMNYACFHEVRMQQFFNAYTIVVGSTGNLGLSIGIMSAKLGFRVIVHMSHDAKQWKKDMLRQVGVQVVEHKGDYSVAVESGRQQALQDENSFFIDDENSANLFAGYAVAARRFQKQLPFVPTKEKPLIVYLPCGVGGGPGGVTYGLKQQFGESVKCYMVEPTQSPCMLIGMVTGKHDQISVEDIGLQNKTIADGLAVGRASKFVGKLMEPLLDGICTVTDDELHRYVKIVYNNYQIYLEPSAVAGFKGLSFVEKLYPEAYHVIWATGGSMVPEQERQKWLQ